MDPAHFAWLHNGILGDKANPLIPDIEVSRVGVNELHFDTQAAVPEKGGMQYAASIESTPPLSPAGVSGKDAVHVHLILRQHPAWGQNVYLMLDNEKFDCRSGCPTLPVSFDGESPKPMKATIPPTGEPALFIDDDRIFIQRILRTKKVAIDVALKSGGRKTLVFETGGLDMSHLPGAAKKK